jgi:hypothetical protein
MQAPCCLFSFALLQSLGALCAGTSAEAVSWLEGQGVSPGRGGWGWLRVWFSACLLLLLLLNMHACAYRMSICV